jgi:hypothetical protein
MIFLFKCQMLINMLVLCLCTNDLFRYLIGQPGKYEDTVSLSRRMKKDHVDKNMEHLVKKNGWYNFYS